jgi:hypothetical protein
LRERRENSPTFSYEGKSRARRREMKEKDVFAEILGRGLTQGVLTADEIHDALPVDALSLDRMEGLMVVLDKLGIRVHCGERLN